jgi:hypothetical protein
LNGDTENCATQSVTKNTRVEARLFWYVMQGKMEQKQTLQ